VPVYGTEFTLALVENKLDEHGLLDDADLREISPGERFTMGPFTINPIRVTHSLVDCVALAVHTPLGVIIHTGDFKVDPTPTDNRLFDLHTFAEYGKDGNVLALLQDSTNAERRGYTPSERAVHPRFDEIFARTDRHVDRYSSVVCYAAFDCPPRFIRCQTSMPRRTTVNANRYAPRTRPDRAGPCGGANDHCHSPGATSSSVYWMPLCDA